MSNLKKRVSQLGFTLIELMVVVAIIGLLLAAGLASYTSVQKTARDGRRIQDVKAIQDALEGYHVINNVYPTVANFTNANMATYFSNGVIPTPPTGGTLVTGGPTAGATAYEYTVTAIGDRYCVCSGVENGLKGNASANSTGVCTFVTTPTATTNRYCLTGVQ
jgi:prepilin-type N-terminal cleavage/methylation domain-containing protein